MHSMRFCRLRAAGLLRGTHVLRFLNSTLETAAELIPVNKLYTLIIERKL